MYNTRPSVNNKFIIYCYRLAHWWVNISYLLNVQSEWINKTLILHQWYWSYEYSDYETESGDPIEFDSYMKPESDLELGDFRLLEVDNPIVIPEDTHVRFIVTSTDVLHDFALPAAGAKMDAAPGRLNQLSFPAMREGSIFGQCSELCGAYHGFMPIEVQITNLDNYLSWISSLSLIPLFIAKIPQIKKINTLY